MEDSCKSHAGFNVGPYLVEFRRHKKKMLPEHAHQIIEHARIEIHWIVDDNGTTHYFNAHFQRLCNSHYQRVLYVLRLPNKCFVDVLKFEYPNWWPKNDQRMNIHKKTCHWLVITQEWRFIMIMTNLYWSHLETRPIMTHGPSSINIVSCYGYERYTVFHGDSAELKRLWERSSKSWMLQVLVETCTQCCNSAFEFQKSLRWTVVWENLTARNLFLQANCPAWLCREQIVSPMANCVYPTVNKLG